MFGFENLFLALAAGCLFAVLLVILVGFLGCCLGLTVVSMKELFPVRKRNLNKYSPEMQEALTEYYNTKNAERRKDIPKTIMIFVCSLSIIICAVLQICS